MSSIAAPRDWFVSMAAILLLSTRASAQTAPFDHRWGGTVYDAFTFDGGEFWTVEDGGRIRHRTATGTVHFQDVPAPVKDALRRIHFIDDATAADGPTGWAVGEMGWMLKTLDGGKNWFILDWAEAPNQQVPAVIPQPGHPDKESLWDVHFIDENRGWLCGLHGIWRTVDGGSSWTRCTLKMQDNAVIFAAPHQQYSDFLKQIEFYSLDIVQRGGPSGGLIGMAAAEPGLVFRTTNGIDWKVALDVRCLCVQTTPGCSTTPGPCAACYNCSTFFLPSIVGCLQEPGNRKCEGKICGTGAGYDKFEAWDVDVSAHPTNKLAVMVGGIEHQCGMVFTSTNDGLTWQKEPHECHLGGTGGAPDCNTHPDWQDVPPGHPDYSTHTFKTRDFGALYGVAILDGDNSAVLAGYGGGHAYREASPPSPVRWRDVSAYNNRLDEVPNAVVNPLMGAAASRTGSATTGKAFIVGMGGTTREKIAGGTGWNDAAGTVHGVPWRIRDIHFITETIGFQVGQFTRIAKTTDSGTTWDHLQQNPPIFDPGAGGDGARLNAVTFAKATGGGPSNAKDKGVTVGGIPTGGARPAIYWTADAGATMWNETDPRTGFSVPAHGVPAGLNDVAFAGFTANGMADYWAAGEKGFILHSSDDGATWSQFIPASGQPTAFTIHGVAYKDINTGLFVGKGPGSGSSAGWAFQRKRTGNPIWSNLTPPASEGVVEFSDVVIAGDTAYAVGEKNVNGVRSGVVMSSAFAGGVFGQFSVVVIPPADGFPLCLTNDSINDLADTPVLTQAEIDPNGELWVGGQCGRVWKWDGTPGGWTEFKSQTDTHILGISFAGTGSSVVGYFGGHRIDFPQGNVVRYR